MTTYYVDLGSPGAWNGRTGQDTSGNQFLGCTGFQHLLDTLAAGDIGYVKGTADLTKTYNVPYDAPSGSITNGEAVTWHDGAGVVQFKGTLATPVLIELTSGNICTDNDVITGSTSGNSITQNGNATRIAFDCDTNQGDNTTNIIRVIGVNSSWTKDGTKALLDGGDVCTDEILFLNNKVFWWFENIDAANSSGSNAGFYISASYVNVFVNCAAYGNGGSGFDFTTCPPVCIRCNAYDNTGSGFDGMNTSHKMLFCSSHDNGASGFISAGSGSYVNCVAYDNVANGFTLSTTDFVMNCIADGNSAKGFSVAAHTAEYFNIIVGTRVTNHSGTGDIGLDCNSEPVITMACYFEDNDGDNIQNTGFHYNVSLDGSTTSSNQEDQANTNEGYTSLTDGSENFTLRSDASMRQVAIIIPLVA